MEQNVTLRKGESVRVILWKIRSFFPEAESSSYFYGTEKNRNPLSRFPFPALVLGLLLFLSFLWVSPLQVLAQTRPAPFFLMGNGQLHIQNVKTKQEARVDLLLPDGSLNESALEEIDKIFGFISHRKGDHISPRLICMLDHFSDLAAPGKVILLTSGYRSPEYNADLKKAGGIVAKTSTHIDGLALDFFIEGIEGKALWELIRGKKCCGVGHYGGKEIHLDAARPRFWEAATSGVDSNESDFNRRMYLSTDLDRYLPCRPLRLSLASVSNFGFGIRAQGALISDPEDDQKINEIKLQMSFTADCLPIPDRESSRRIDLLLPQDIKPGRYRLRLEFCQRPFEQMPQSLLSNPFEIVAGF